METLAIFVLAAVFMEGIINIIDSVKEKETSWKYWASLVGGIALSILIAYNWNLNLFKMVGFPEGNVPLVGVILTGFIISRGSNYIADLLKMIPA